MRTRLSGGVGAGRAILPATRFGIVALIIMERAPLSGLGLFLNFVSQKIIRRFLVVRLQGIKLFLNSFVFFPR